MRRILERAHMLYEHDNLSPAMFVDYGWPIMNKALLGLDQGVVLLTAPPNPGKSTLLMNMYVQIITRNSHVFVLDFSLDDSFEDRVRSTVARFAKIPINWVKLPANAPDSAKQARRASYKTWADSLTPQLDIIDESDFDNRARNLSVIRKVVRDTAEKLQEDKRLVVIVDGFHNIAVDELRGADKNERQAYLSAEMKSLAAATKSIIFAGAHSPKGSMRRGLTQDAVKGAGEPTYDARVIANLYSDHKVHRGLAQVYHDVYLPHEPDVRVRQPVVELDIVKNKASGFCDIAFYKFIPEYAYGKSRVARACATRDGETAQVTTLAEVYAAIEESCR